MTWLGSREIGQACSWVGNGTETEGAVRTEIYCCRESAILVLDSRLVKTPDS